MARSLKAERESNGPGARSAKHLIEWQVIPVSSDNCDRDQPDFTTDATLSRRRVTIRSSEIEEQMVMAIITLKPYAVPPLFSLRANPPTVSNE